MGNGNGVRLRVSPNTLTAKTPGEEVALSVDVYNSTDVIDGFDLAVVGLDQDASVEYQPKDISLFPDSEERVDLKVTIPKTYSSGDHTLAVRITSKTDPEVYSYQEIPLAVKAVPDPTLKVDPDSLTAGRRGRFAATITNDGGAPVDVRFTGDDLENHLSFDFNRERIKVNGGAQQSSSVTVTGRRPFAGDPVTRLVTITANGPDTALKETVTLVQRPWIPRIVITLGLVLGLLGFWAVIVGAAIDKILDDTDTDLAASITDGVDDVLDKLAPAAGASAVGSATDIGGTGGPVPDGEAGVVRGRITVYDAEAGPTEEPVPIAGATVAAVPLNANDQIDTERDPLVGITNDAGSFKIGDMGRGRYWLRVSAPGYEPVWIGKVKEETENQQGDAGPARWRVPVDTEDMSNVDVLDIPWSGTLRNVALVIAPGSVSGSVTTGEVNAGTEVILALVDPTGLDTEPTVMFSVKTGKSGTFLFPCAPPKAGSDAICTPSPPVPETTSVAALDVAPEPQPRPLQPGTYLLTFKKTGFASQQLTTEITPGSELPSVDITLAAGSTGSFVAEGVVKSGEEGLAGVTVEVSGASAVKTVTDQDGKYTFSVPEPGDYNISFSKAGYASAAGQASITDGEKPTKIEPTSMTSEPLPASGQVVDHNGVPLDGVDVKVLSSHDPEWCESPDIPVVTQTASGGTFLIPDVGLGAGSLCFSKASYAPAVVPFVGVPGAPIAGLEAVLYELITIQGEVVLDRGPIGLAGWDQIAFADSRESTTCNTGSSYQTVVFSGSMLERIQIRASITQPAPLGADIGTNLRIWDPRQPATPVAESAAPLARSQADHYVTYAFNSNVDPGREYLIEWDHGDADDVEVGWLKSSSGADPYPAGSSFACLETGDFPSGPGAPEDFEFAAVTSFAELTSSGNPFPTVGVGNASVVIDGVEKTTTAVDGSFELSAAAGPRTLAVSKPGYETAILNFEPTPDGAPLLVSLRLLGSLRGRINCEGCEVSQLEVRLNEGTTLFKAVPIGSGGKFEVKDLPTPSVVAITARTPGGILEWDFIVGAGEKKDVGDIVSRR